MAARTAVLCWGLVCADEQRQGRAARAPTARRKRASVLGNARYASKSQHGPGGAADPASLNAAVGYAPSGRFTAIPGRRGNRAGVGAILRNTWSVRRSAAGYGDTARTSPTSKPNSRAATAPAREL